MKKISTIMLGIIILAAILAFAFKDKLLQKFFEPTPTTIPEGKLVTEEEKELPVNPATTTPQVLPPPAKVPAKVILKEPIAVVENLSIPWELVFLPNGDMLVTERGGKLLRIGQNKKVIQISGVAHTGEGGLLGLALHPQFTNNNYIYIYLTTKSVGGLTNRVERYKINDATLSDRKIIIENIPGASNHDGGRIAFGPDGNLYIGTGDAGNTENSQNINSLAGKILRVTADGAIPADNPFGSAVYSYGHRNVQGLAWDSSGNLWSTEHGRSGAKSGLDELNKIVKGGNYGWPDFEGDETGEGIILPQLHSGETDTWAPSGLEIVNNHALFAGLRGQALYLSNVSSGSAGKLSSFFKTKYGRLRTVVLGPDKMLYFLTNNTDGWGKPTSTDDRIIKIDPKLFGI